METGQEVGEAGPVFRRGGPATSHHAKPVGGKIEKKVVERRVTVCFFFHVRMLFTKIIVFGSMLKMHW